MIKILVELILIVVPIIILAIASEIYEKGNIMKIAYIILTIMMLLIILLTLISFFLYILSIRF